LRLKSLPGKVLPAGDVDILSEFQTEKFATMVTNYKIIKGSQLSSGYYQVQIDGQGIGIFSKLMMQLKNLPLFSLLPFVEQYQKDFTYQGTFYLGALSESNFIIRLSEYQKEKKVLEQKPVVELLEFYRTFEALYQKLDELYGNILGQIHSGSEMRLFEKEYVVALAPIYQSMMMELSEKKARKVEGQTYDEIQFIAREFGLLVSDLLGDTRKINNLDQNTKSRLRAKFAPRIKKYRDLCNEQLKILQGYIQ
jgi:hypothetical protein